MQFRMNGKELKDAINICRLRGKYNEGMGNKTSVLSDDIFIEVEGNTVYIQNANNYTYVVYRYTDEEATSGMVSLSGSTIEKYLTDTDIVFKSDDGKIELASGNSVVTLPVLGRHDDLHVIYRLKPKLRNLTRRSIMMAMREGEEILVTETLALKTMLEVNSAVLSEAMSLAEKVGNSIYKIDWNGKKLLISSTKTGECVYTEVSAIGNDRKATVEISLPIANIISKEEDVVILYDDEKPVIFANEKITVLRAPRLGN
tara:strand:- start:4417 stop:5190 length:774 start_codon:yes stop_codon:yes gene_type:complete